MVLTEEQAIEMLAYLFSAAEISLVEPTHYPILRLIDAGSRLMGYLLEHDPARTGAFLRRFKEEVDERRTWMVRDRQAFDEFVRAAPATIAAEVKRLAGEPAP
jgi:hypothetical protein